VSVSAKSKSRGGELRLAVNDDSVTSRVIITSRRVQLLSIDRRRPMTSHARARLFPVDSADGMNGQRASL